MKLKNKKTGEIVEAHEIDLIDNYVYLKIFRAGDYDTKQYNSLAGLNEEWEDYKETKELYFVDARLDDYIGILDTEKTPKWCERIIELGLGFETAEETERAVEKLKALNRLQNAGFVFHFGDPVFDYQGDHHESLYGMAEFEVMNYEGVEKDLDILFGGEE